MKHMLADSVQKQTEAEVANMVLVLCEGASWMDDNFSTPAGHQSFYKIILFTHISTQLIKTDDTFFCKAAWECLEI